MGLTFREDWANEWATEDEAHTLNINVFDDSDGSDFDGSGTRSATITITKAGGGDLDAAVEDVAVDTWANASNLIQHAITAANLGTTGQAYRFVITIVDGATTYPSYAGFFSVVPFRPSIVIVDADLTAREPVLAKSNVLPPGWSNWQPAILDSAKTMYRDIRNMGDLVTRIALDPQSLREMHVALALHHAFTALWKLPSEDDPDYAKAVWWRERYQEERGRFKDLSDTDDSGHAETDAEQHGPHSVWGWTARG